MKRDVDVTWRTSPKSSSDRSNRGVLQTSSSELIVVDLIIPPCPKEKPSFSRGVCTRAYIGMYTYTYTHSIPAHSCTCLRASACRYI